MSFYTRSHLNHRQPDRLLFVLSLDPPFPPTYNVAIRRPAHLASAAFDGVAALPESVTFRLVPPGIYAQNAIYVAEQDIPPRAQAELSAAARGER